MSANVYDLPPDFPERLRALREERYLTQSDLAERSGLAARSIHEFESGRRRRVLAKSIMLLAGALDVSVAFLLNGVEDRDESGTGPSADGEAAPARPSRAPTQPQIAGRFLKIALPVLVAGAAVAAIALSMRPDVIGVTEVDEMAGVVAVREPATGDVLWRREFRDRIWVAAPSPGDERVLLVGLDGGTHEGGRLVALDLEDGREIWSVKPDREAVVRAYGEDSVTGGGFSCIELHTADLQGDGAPEIVAYFHHSRWFPAAVCVATPDGRLQSTYLNRGHIYDIVAADIDGDDRDEIVCAGTNNAPRYNGPTLFVLDDGHRTGAAVDPETSPGAGIADSSLVRIVIPNLPADVLAAIDPGCRAEGGRLGTYLAADGLHLQADVGCRAVGMYVMTLDTDLRPLDIGISDALRTLYAAAGVDDAAWRRSWVDGHVRFERGERVPAPGMP